MDWKRGTPLRPSWATFNSLWIPELYGRWRTNGAFITKFNQFRHHRLRSHSTQCFHTQNIRMCNLDSPFQSFRTIRSFSNRVGDVLLTIILKALQHRYIGPLPALHLRHHRPRRWPEVTVISKGKVPLTYLLQFHFMSCFWDGMWLTQEPPCRFQTICFQLLVLHCCRKLYLFIFDVLVLVYGSFDGIWWISI